MENEGKLIDKLPERNNEYYRVGYSDGLIEGRKMAMEALIKNEQNKTNIRMLISSEEIITQ